MARRTKAQPTDTADVETIAPAVDQVLDRAGATDFDPAKLESEEAPAKKPWKNRVGYWRDNDAGVRIEEDRRAGLSTIISREPLPEKAVEHLEDRGWVEDREAGGYSKRIDKLRPGESREKADETVLEVDNIIRAEKGLEPRQSFYISRS